MNSRARCARARLLFLKSQARCARAWLLFLKSQARCARARLLFLPARCVASLPGPFLFLKSQARCARARLLFLNSRARCARDWLLSSRPRAESASLAGCAARGAAAPPCSARASTPAGCPPPPGPGTPAALWPLLPLPGSTAAGLAACSTLAQGSEGTSRHVGSRAPSTRTDSSLCFRN